MKVKRSDDLTVALDRMRQEEAEEGIEKIEPRDYFRGSEVGHCSNQINFRRRGTPVSDRGVNKTRFLEDGHLHQAVLSAELRKAGIKLTGEEEESLETIRVGKTDITIKAHKDGTVKIDGEEYLLEVKSVKEAKFQELMKTNDVSAYYDQIQIYLYLYQYPVCKLIVVDRNSSLRLEYTIKYDDARVKFLLKKLAQIEKDLAADTVSSRDYPRTSKECGWCPYFEGCWGVQRGRYAHGEKMEKAIEIEGKKEVKAWEVGIDLYRKYSRLSQEAKQYKEEADGLMGMLFTKFKATKIHGEGGSVIKSISSKQVPDKTAIRELILKGSIPVETLETVSIRYNIGKEDEE